jgi:hypothetical protein
LGPAVNTCTNTILVIPVLLTIIAQQNKTKIMFNILKCEKHANALTFLVTKYVAYI